VWHPCTTFSGWARTPPTTTFSRRTAGWRRSIIPDRNPGDAEAEGRFKEVTAAYEVLGDAGKAGRVRPLRDHTESAVNWPPPQPNFGPFHTVHDQFFGGSVERGRNVQTRSGHHARGGGRGVRQDDHRQEAGPVCARVGGQGGTSFRAVRRVSAARGTRRSGPAPFQMTRRLQPLRGDSAGSSRTGAPTVSGTG
jgi:hypothetical protein